MNALRHGAHNGDGQYAFSNTVPPEAIRAMFGVCTISWPYTEQMRGLCSSLMNTTAFMGRWSYVAFRSGCNVW
jgi:hypothetical protein